MTWTAYEVDDAAMTTMIATDEDDVCICPYCTAEHYYECASATGEVADVTCCSERHCLTKAAYKREFPQDYAALYEDDDENF